MTAPTLYSCTMSLDGFMAGPDGDMQWLLPHLGPHPVGDTVMARIGSLLIGNRTFGGDDPNRGTDKEGAFSGVWQGPAVVLTHSPPAEPVPDVTFVSDLHEALSTAREAAGDRDVDILGDGTRLCDRPGGRSVDLVKKDVVDGPATTSLWYDVRR